ncbi:MAG: trehalose-phosphatase [Alphaproteobacteria bacterium]
MSEPTPASASIPTPSRDWALFLDFDGTLVEIAEHPEAIEVPDDLPALLRVISEHLGGALAVVSGRPVKQIDRHLDGAVPNVAGLHGLEYRAAGNPVSLGAPPNGELEGVRQALRGFVVHHAGLILEDKQASIVLHYRGRPDLEAECRRQAENAAAAHPETLEVLAGKMVFEIKPAGIDKGHAVARFLAEPAFAGRRPVFIGDDVTDEHGFEAVLARSGHAIVVGDRTPSAAPVRFDTVADLFTWLRTLPDRL